MGELFASVEFGCPFLCNSVGPGTPFATPLLIISDIVRTLGVIGGFTVILLLPAAMAKVRTGGQWARFIALGLFALTLTNGNAHHFGDTPTIGTVLGFAGVGFAIYGMIRFWRELPTRQRPE